jgi:hypothetical protein
MQFFSCTIMIVCNHTIMIVCDHMAWRCSGVIFQLQNVDYMQSQGLTLLWCNFSGAGGTRRGAEQIWLHVPHCSPPQTSTHLPVLQHRTGTSVLSQPTICVCTVTANMCIHFHSQQYVCAYVISLWNSPNHICIIPVWGNKLWFDLVWTNTLLHFIKQILMKLIDW